MPWARIDENADDHPKIVGLCDGAFRLWVQGLLYCQRHLTDGFIPDAAVRDMRAYSPKRRRELTTALLWEEAEKGIRVHDHLDWNDSREHVTRARKLARDRMQKLRKGKKAVTPNVTRHETRDVRDFTSLHFQRSEDQNVERAREARGVHETDWFEECSRLHGRTCNGRQGHATRMLLDAEKAKRIS